MTLLGVARLFLPVLSCARLRGDIKGEETIETPSLDQAAAVTVYVCTFRPARVVCFFFTLYVAFTHGANRFNVWNFCWDILTTAVGASRGCCILQTNEAITSPFLLHFHTPALLPLDQFFFTPPMLLFSAALELRSSRWTVQNLIHGDSHRATFNTYSHGAPPSRSRINFRLGQPCVFAFVSRNGHIIRCSNMH
jgi:hypothetical protein